jgi:hypothetical protein
MANGNFAGGDGSELNPFLIEDAHDLDAIRNGLDKHYKLINDIDLNISPYNEGEGWIPIGSSQRPFTGSLNGDNYKIKKLYANRPGSSYQGLFLIANNSIFKNIKLKDVNIIGRTNVGSLVGMLGGISQIIKVSSMGIIRVAEYSGGLVGRTSYESSVAPNRTYISFSSFKGEIISQKDNPDSGIHYIGGLIGILEGVITNSYFTGEIIFKHPAISRCGGIVGIIHPDSEVKNTYANNMFDTSEVETITQLGGIFGYLSDTATSIVKNSFWNIETSGITTPSVGSTGLTTQQMQTAQTFIDASWLGELNEDGTPVWILKDGEYPKLWFERDTIDNKYLMQENGNIKVPTLTELLAVEETQINKELFDLYGTTNFNYIFGNVDEKTKMMEIGKIGDKKILGCKIFRFKDIEKLDLIEVVKGGDLDG